MSLYKAPIVGAQWFVNFLLHSHGLYTRVFQFKFDIIFDPEAKTRCVGGCVGAARRQRRTLHHYAIGARVGPSGCAEQKQCTSPKK